MAPADPRPPSTDEEQQREQEWLREQEERDWERQQEEEANWRSLHDPTFDGYHDDAALEARRDAGIE